MAVDTPEEGSPAAQSTRMLRMRRSQVISYNENVISGTAHRRSSVAAGNRTISGETLIDNEPAQNLLQDGIDALNMDWNIKSSKSDSKTGEGILNAKLPRRKSTRLEKLVKATDEIVSKVSVLGKRGRDAVDAGKAAAVDVAKSVQRRASLRPRLDPEEDIQEETPRKKAKLSKPEVHFEEPVKSTKLKISQPRPRVKHWLKQGLYVGQHRNFKSRLTEQENKLLAAELPPERKILPLPMFAGERLLEDGRDFKLPYDIFSPLPPGQPKPEEWKKKQRNVFIGDAASLWKHTQPKESSKCICTPESGCGDECQNRFMFYECDDSNCNIGAKGCTNRSFEQLRQRYKVGSKYHIGVEVIKTADRGYGVRSNRSFEPHQIIVEYAGEIITQEECDARMNTRYKDNDCYYLMHFDQNMIIDATRGSIARFVNHSCEPNCKMVKWTVAGKPRMALFAGEKGIITGDELTYDYNFDPFSAKNVQQCRCGSAACRGVLGPKPKDTKPAAPAPTTQTKGVKRKIQEVVAVASSKMTSEKPNKKRKSTGSTSVADSPVTARPSVSMEDMIVDAKTPGRKPSKLIKRSASSTTNKRTNGNPLKQVAAAARRRVQEAVEASTAPRRTRSVVEKPPTTAKRTLGESIRQGVARSVRRRKTLSVMPNGGLLESQSTIRVIQDDEEEK